PGSSRGKGAPDQDETATQLSKSDAAAVRSACQSLRRGATWSIVHLMAHVAVAGVLLWQHEQQAFLQQHLTQAMLLGYVVCAFVCSSVAALIGTRGAS